MVVKKKKNRLLRAGAIQDSTDSPQESVEPATEAEAPVAEPEDSGIGGRANRIRAKKTINKQVKKKAKTEVVASSPSDDDDAVSDDLDLLEADIKIINARQFFSKMLNGFDQYSVNRFWMNHGKLLVATIDCQNDNLFKIEIEPTEFGQELAQIVWDEVDGEGQDPATIDVSEDGWHFQYECTDGE